MGREPSATSSPLLTSITMSTGTSSIVTTGASPWNLRLWFREAVGDSAARHRSRAEVTRYHRPGAVRNWKDRNFRDLHPPVRFQGGNGVPGARPRAHSRACAADPEGSHRTW